MRVGGVDGRAGTVAGTSSGGGWWGAGLAWTFLV